MEYAVIAILIVVIVVLLVRQPSTGNLVDTVNQLSKRVRELEAEGAIDRGTIRATDDKIYKLMRVVSRLAEGLQTLNQQIVNLDEVPDWEPPSDLMEWLIIPTVAHTQQPDVLVFQNLGELFSDEELRELAFELGVDYDNLSGTNKRAKARELTLLMVRYKKLDVLNKLGKELRPNAIWPMITS